MGGWVKWVRESSLRIGLEKMSDISSDIRHKSFIHSRWVGGCRNYSADSTWNEKCLLFLRKLDIRPLYVVDGWVGAGFILLNLIHSRCVGEWIIISTEIKMKKCLLFLMKLDIRPLYVVDGGWVRDLFCWTLNIAGVWVSESLFRLNIKWKNSCYSWWN